MRKSPKSPACNIVHVDANGSRSIFRGPYKSEGIAHAQLTHWLKRQNWPANVRLQHQHYRNDGEPVCSCVDVIEGGLGSYGRKVGSYMVRAVECDA